MFEDVGQKLLEARVIDDAALQKAHLSMKNAGGTLTSNLIKVGAVTEEGLGEFLADLYRVPAVDLRKVEADPACVKLLPADVALKFMALPLSRNGRRLTVAMVNPSNIFALDDIKFITGFEVEPVVAPEPALKKALDKYYDQAGTMADVMKGMEEDLEVVEEMEDEASRRQHVDGRRGAGRQADQRAPRPTRCKRGRLATSTSSRSSTSCACATASTARCYEMMKPPLKLQGGAHLAPQDHGRSSTSPSAACRRTAASSSRCGNRVDRLPRLDAARRSSARRS